MAVHEVILPKTGMNMDDVLLIEWLVEEGAHVEEGAPLFRMETDKVEVDAESFDTGYLHITVAAGVSLPIGTTIGYLAETRDEYADLVAA